MAQEAPSRLARALLVLGGVLLLGVAWAWAQLPRPGEARIEVTPELVGLRIWQSYVWVLRTPHGAALVDAGDDVEGQKLLAELKARGVSPGEVHTVLITHGHKDHWAAAHLFPNARVVVGPGEAAVVRGEWRLTSLAGQLTQRFFPTPPLPARLEEVKDGEVLEVDGEKIGVIHVPGHTPGSAMYLWRDVLFTGDSLLGRSHQVVPAPSLVSEDREQNIASLRKLPEVPFTRIADGHTGLTLNAREKLRAALE